MGKEEISLGKEIVQGELTRIGRRLESNVET